MNNSIKRIWNCVTTVLICLLVILVVLLWGFKLLGYEVMVVQSGSMEPNYHVGALVYVKPVDARQLAVGDVITFELGGGVRGTHRIVEIVEEGDSRSFVTKGDNNAEKDSNPVQEQAIVGQVKFTIPQLGFLVTYIQSPSGTYTAISAAALLLLLTVLPDIIFPKGKEDNTQQKEANDQ